MRGTWTEQMPGICLHAHQTRTSEYSGSNQSSEPGAFISDQGEWHFEEDWEENAPSWVEMSGRKSLDTANARFEKFFPLHTSCADILERFVHYQSRFHSSNLPKSIKDFVDACMACQQFSSQESDRIWRCNERDSRPPDYNRYGCVEWSHCYFGARRFWTDPWDCEPGQEHLCADPLSEFNVDEWVSQCLARPKSSSSNLFSLSALQRQPQGFIRSEGPLMRCPTEILRLIASHLPLRSAINLHASSRRLSAMINEKERDFWRSHTRRLHRPWFWELEGHQDPSAEVPSYANWETLLIALSRSRREIMKGAYPWWPAVSSNPNSDAAASEHDMIEVNTPSLPLGLRNRQRIWMCLEFLDVPAETGKLEVG